ncbi:MAG: glycosyltransferase family 4 protein [Janthinobacterium lividum]
MRVVLMMNFVAPYRVPLLEALHDRVGALQIWLSTRMERDRAWTPDWGRLDVAVQRTVTVCKRQAYGPEFSRDLEIHVPYDTLPRLVAARPDAIIAAELGARSVQAALYRRTRRGMPLLIWATLSERSERDWGPIRRAVRRFILAAADGVMVNGQSGARYIRTFGVPDERIFVVNQPVDVDLFANEPARRPTDGVSRLLVCGMLVKRKGIHLLCAVLDAWAIAHRDRRIEVWFVGEGELADAIAARPSPANVDYRLLGHKTYAELPPLYAQVSHFVLPTLMDEWGLVVNEAMASGLPVLGSIHSQAVEELVTEGVDGWIFDPLDSVSFAAALDRALLAEPAQLATMGAAARRRISGLTPQAAADRIAHALQSTLAKLRPAKPNAAARYATAIRSSEP